MKFLVRANDTFKLYWDILILIIAIVNSFTIPITLAFEEINESLSGSATYVLLNLIGTIVFTIDILLNLNTTYYDLDGEEILERKKIIRNYLSKMFTIDLISSLPLESINGIPKTPKPQNPKTPRERNKIKYNMKISSSLLILHCGIILRTTGS